MKEKIKNLFKNLFKRDFPVIFLDQGPLSNKIVLVGRQGPLGVVRVHKYKDGLLHEYGEDIKEEMIGATIAVILFGRKSGVKKLADSLYKLYEDMEGDE